MENLPETLDCFFLFLDSVLQNFLWFVKIRVSNFKAIDLYWRIYCKEDDDKMQDIKKIFITI